MSREERSEHRSELRGYMILFGMFLLVVASFAFSGYLHKNLMMIFPEYVSGWSILSEGNRQITDQIGHTLIHMDWLPISIGILAGCIFLLAVSLHRDLIER